jgi:hypothetical protein
VSPFCALIARSVKNDDYRAQLRKMADTGTALAIKREKDGSRSSNRKP